MSKTITHASLFSGIGGAELAASWCGWENVFHCEINPFGRRVLKYHFPNSISYEDITQTDFTEWKGRIDVLTGGFPCQPFSIAGKRKGASDDRYLWTEMLRAIHEIQPTWVVGENVAGIISMVELGQITQMVCGGALFEENHLYREDRKFTIERICEDLEREGYSVQPFVIPACAVGAPHRRDRVWIVAHTDSHRQRDWKNKQNTNSRIHRETNRCNDGKDEAAANTEMSGSKRERIKGQRKIQSNRRNCKDIQSSFRDFPTQSAVCCGNDGISDRLDGITFPRWRAESIKAYGNAWVPQVAYEIFKAIDKEL